MLQCYQVLTHRTWLQQTQGYRVVWAYVSHSVPVQVKIAAWVILRARAGSCFRAASFWVEHLQGEKIVEEEKLKDGRWGKVGAGWEERAGEEKTCWGGWRWMKEGVAGFLFRTPPPPAPPTATLFRLESQGSVSLQGKHGLMPLFTVFKFKFLPLFNYTEISCKLF